MGPEDLKTFAHHGRIIFKMTEHGSINRLVIETDAYDYHLTGHIIQALPNVPRITAPAYNTSKRPLPSDMGKHTLRLLSFKGDFLKPCPGTRNYICCGYQILNVGTNCPLDCSYCILQDYFNKPDLRVFVNYEKELDRILDHIDKNPSRMFRIGTGEFTDSLALDPVTQWSKVLIPRFSARKNAILELKTKTVNIDNIIKSKYRDRIIISWSLNSQHICSTEEHRAPAIKRRLEAARICQREGFVLGFHFDPIIAYPGWKKGYLETIELMDKYIDPKGIAWISMGSMRFMPTLKTIVMKRHPDTRIFIGEFIDGLDGKKRYFKPIRIELYGFMRKHLERWHNDLGLYLCMESDEIWKKGLGWSPGTSEGLSDYLDSRVLPERWRAYR